MAAESGNQVSIEYTMKIDDDTVVASNVGSEPYSYTEGARQVIPGVEEALRGMKAGEEKAFTVPPENGFGERSDKAFQEVEKTIVPKESRKVDAQLQGQDEKGRVFSARVADVKEDSILLDLNHPLAGKTLHFEVKVLEVKEPEG